MSQPAYLTVVYRIDDREACEEQLQRITDLLLAKPSREKPLTVQAIRVGDVVDAFDEATRVVSAGPLNIHSVRTAVAEIAEKLGAQPPRGGPSPR